MNERNLNKLGSQFIRKTLNPSVGELVGIYYQGDFSAPLAFACEQQCKDLGVEYYMQEIGLLENKRWIDIANKQNNPDAYLKEFGEKLLERMKRTTHYLQIDEFANTERAVLTPEDKKRIKNVTVDMTEYRRNHTKWLIVDAPTREFAKACGMEQKEFDHFFLKACLADYAAMAERVEPLKEVMSGQKSFEVTGYRTKLTGEFVDVAAVPCVGERNLPDGECYTAPKADSINGHICFGKTPWGDRVFPWVFFEIEQGRVVFAKSETDDLTDSLNYLLDTDEGSRSFGEWAIGFNPMIDKVVGNQLFDEKVWGTMHMAIGRCLPQTPNGVVSKIHHDLVKDQRDQAGGGDIFIDGELIRRNGLFVPKKLQGLNPKRLVF